MINNCCDCICCKKRKNKKKQETDTERMLRLQENYDSWWRYLEGCRVARLTSKKNERYD